MFIASTHSDGDHRQMGKRVAQWWEQCSLDSNPGVDAICWLSLLLILFFARKRFLPGTAGLPSSQKPTFPNSNPNFRDGRRRTTRWMYYLKVIIVILFTNFSKLLNSLLWVCGLTQVSIWWLLNCFIHPSTHCSDLHISTNHCLGYVRERFPLRQPLFLPEESNSSNCNVFFPF